MRGELQRSAAAVRAATLALARGARRGAPWVCSPAVARSLDDTRRAYAEEIRAVSDIRREALIEALAGWRKLVTPKGLEPLFSA